MLLDVAEAAAYLRVHTSTLASARCYGKPPAFIKGRKKIYYDLKELERYAKEKGFDLSEGALP
jgi:hypothetical protein